MGWRHSNTGRHSWGRLIWSTGPAVKRNNGRARHTARQVRHKLLLAACKLRQHWLTRALQAPRLRLRVACVECSESGIVGKGQTLDLQGGGEAPKGRGITFTVLYGRLVGVRSRSRSRGAAH